MSPTKRKSIPVTTYFGGRLNKRASPTKMAVAMQWGRPISVMKYVVTGMDLRLVGDIGNCTVCSKLLSFEQVKNQVTRVKFKNCTN